MLAYSLDNLRLLKLLYDAGYSLPDGDFTETDVCAERAFDLFYAATEQILGSFELDPDEDDEGYGYEYQPGKISHPRLKRLYELATCSDDHERIENEINPYLRVGTSYYCRMYLSVNDTWDGYVVEFYQFDYSMLSDFVECFIMLEKTVTKLLVEFETREKERSIAGLCSTLQIVIDSQTSAGGSQNEDSLCDRCVTAVSIGDGENGQRGRSQSERVPMYDRPVRRIAF